MSRCPICGDVAVHSLVSSDLEEWDCCNCIYFKITQFNALLLQRYLHTNPAHRMELSRYCYEENAKHPPRSFSLLNAFFMNQPIFA